MHHLCFTVLLKMCNVDLSLGKEDFFAAMPISNEQWRVEVSMLS